MNTLIEMETNHYAWQPEGMGTHVWYRLPSSGPREWVARTTRGSNEWTEVFVWTSPAITAPPPLSTPQSVLLTVTPTMTIDVERDRVTLNAAVAGPRAIFAGGDLFLVAAAAAHHWAQRAAERERSYGPSLRRSALLSAEQFAAVRDACVYQAVNGSHDTLEGFRGVSVEIDHTNNAKVWDF